MVETRLDLQEFLVETLGSDAVYFQPPETIKMEYPCCVYSRDTIKTGFANNAGYRFSAKYQITFIGFEPDLDYDIFDKMSRLPMCTYDRHFVSDTLHHDVFNLYLPLVFPDEES